MTRKLDDMIELPKSQPKRTYKEDLECEMVMVKMPRCMSFLGSTNAYDEPIGSLGMMNNEVGNTSPQSTQQILPSFHGICLDVDFRTSIEESLDQTNYLRDVGLTNHNISFSSKEVPSFDESEPQPNRLPNCPSLDISLGDQKGPEPPIKPHSPDSFRMKEVDHLTIHTPPSPHVAFFHPKDMYCYYHPCIDDPKKHYGFKPGLLGHSRSLGVDFSNLEMIEDDWQFESKEVSFLGEGL
ncbi:hypothetical protein Tco_0968427 [Tanacetum coccineum]